MASDKKVHQITAFNSGEYSDKLAGRVDIESFGHSARLMSNFMAEPTGGIRKFYGTDFITEIEAPREMVLVPFINNYNTMTFVIKLGNVGLLLGDTYQELDISIPNIADLSKLRWLQINDRLIFAHPDVQPFAIDFYGYVDEKPKFLNGVVSFIDVPYFPIGYTGDYRSPLVANGISGTVKLTRADAAIQVVMPWPGPLATSSDYIRLATNGEYLYDNSQWLFATDDFSMESSKFELVRKRDGVETVVATVYPGVVEIKSNTYNNDYIEENPNWGINPNGIMTLAASGGRPGTTPGTGASGGTIVSGGVKRYYCQERMSRELLAMRLRATMFDKTEIVNNTLILKGSDISAEVLSSDEFYFRVTETPMYYKGIEALAPDPVYESEYVFVSVDEINPEYMVGRKIKIHMNTDNFITPWYQEMDVAHPMVVYSNGHFYRNTTNGKAGSIQPAHLSGIVSDGSINWEYLHSGSASASIIEADKNSITVQLPDGQYLPVLSLVENTFKTYQWSIWGKDGIHPSHIYMQNNRLGLICNTKGYGAWNAMSCSDNFFDYSTEQYGQQYDTSAIVHIITNNPDNKINWVLSFNQLYMGSYSGEFTLTASNNIFTPTTIKLDRVSVLGGTDVMPLKYKELNLFVGSTGQELYTIGYDYTRDDYVPKSLGYLTEHLLEQGIRRMEAINNRDQNVYLVHDNGNMSILNYVSDQQILGYSRLNMEGLVWDFCYTYSNQTRAGYMAVERRDGHISLERVSLYNPRYMLSTENVVIDGEGTTTYAAPRFAGKNVYIIDNDTKQFTLVQWPADGIYDFGYPVKNVTIGQEMTCELHSQPAFGRKAEGLQQQAIMTSLRLLESGTFEYGASNDFTSMFPYKTWGRQDAWGEWHELYTGDAILNIPTGYAKNANEGTGPYANSTGIGINIRATTPEPFNLLSIMEVYQ